MPFSIPVNSQSSGDAGKSSGFSIPVSQESSTSDVAKTVASMPERFGAGVAMALPNIIDQAVAGPQMLYRGMTGREHDDSPLWEPFYSSEDFLQSMPGALRPHTPTTVAGKAVDAAGNVLSQLVAGKSPESKIPSIVNPKIESLVKSESSGGRSAVQKEMMSEDKANAFIAKSMLKADHSPQEVMDIMRRSNKFGTTVGESAKNPKMLGLESKISGMNRPGGKTMRDFAEDRVNPESNVSVQQRLQAMADPMLAKMKESSDNIGKLVKSSPKTPINMSAIRDSLSHEEIIPGTPANTTTKKLNEYFDWAKSQGDTFAAWHKVKQNIWDLKSEAKNPSAPEKLDMATVKKYYKKVNDVLSRRTPGLPEDLLTTGGKYAAQNDVYRQNLAGKTISEIVAKAPTGGTPSSTLSYLYKKLAGSPAEQEKLFGQMPVATQRGMMDLLKSIKDMARGNLRDVSKSVEEGSAAFPKTKQGAIHKLGDWLVDMLTKKDYDALAKALTRPDIEEIAKKIGYRKTPPSDKEIEDIVEQTIGAGDFSPNQPALPNPQMKISTNPPKQIQ